MLPGPVAVLSVPLAVCACTGTEAIKPAAVNARQRLLWRKRFKVDGSIDFLVKTCKRHIDALDALKQTAVKSNQIQQLSCLFWSR